MCGSGSGVAVFWRCFAESDPLNPNPKGPCTQIVYTLALK